MPPTLSSYFSACRKKLLENLSEREASAKPAKNFRDAKLEARTRRANSTRSAKPAKLSRLSEREDRHGKSTTLYVLRACCERVAWNYIQYTICQVELSRNNLHIIVSLSSFPNFFSSTFAGLLLPEPWTCKAPWFSMSKLPPKSKLHCINKVKFASWTKKFTHYTQFVKFFGFFHFLPLPLVLICNCLLASRLQLLRGSRFSMSKSSTLVLGLEKT